MNPHPNLPRHTFSPRRQGTGVLKQASISAGEQRERPREWIPELPRSRAASCGPGLLQQKTAREALVSDVPFFFSAVLSATLKLWTPDFLARGEGVWGMPYRIQQVGKLNRGLTERVPEVFIFFTAPKSRWRFRVKWGYCTRVCACVCMCVFFDC